MKRLSGPLRGAGVGIVLLVLVLMPFFKGLFFWTELLPAIALVALAFALWIVGRRLGDLSVGVPGGVAGGALLALAGCYALQFVWAVYPRGNLDWLLRVLAGWFVFVMFRAEASTLWRRRLAWVMVASASALAIHGFAEFTGMRLFDMDLSQRLAEIGFAGRMITALQYPNTAAAYFLAALIIGLGLGLESSKAWMKGLIGGLGALFTVAFLFTVSRGAVVVVPFGLTLLFLGLGRERWWPGVLLLGAAVAPSLVLAGRIGAMAMERNFAGAFCWISLAMVAGALLGVATWALGRQPLKHQVASVAVVAVIGSIGLAGRPMLPQQATRLLDINLRTQNVILRFTYTYDALRMVADQPLGRGGWGWARSYRQYAAFNYTARETHNHFAQTAVDAGIPGLIGFVTALLAAFWGAWRNRIDNPLGWAIAAGAALIAGHSLIDFNLSYGGVWLLLWSSLGVALSGATPGRREGIQSTSALAVAVTLMLAATGLWQGAQLSEEATSLAEDGNRVDSQRIAVKAAAWDPLLSEALIQTAEHSKLLQAVKVDPTNPEAWFALAVSHELRREWQLGLDAIRQAAQLEPWASRYVDKEARLAGYLMLDELAAGRRESAAGIAGRLVKLEEQWTDRLAMAAPHQKLWNAAREKLDAGTHLRFGQARFLHGDIPGATKLLQAAAKVGLLNSEAEVWLYALYEIQGDSAGMKALENQPWVRFRGSNPVYRAIRY